MSLRFTTTPSAKNNNNVMLAQQLAVSSNILLGKVIFSLVKKERLVYWLLYPSCLVRFDFAANIVAV